MGKEELTISQALNLAIEKHTRGKLNEAEILYKKILDKDPCNSDALHLLGVISYQLGKYEDAIKDISKAIQLKPNNAIYYSNLGMVYDMLGNEERSAENFKKALEIDPEHKNAYLTYYNLGVFFKDKGEIKEALEHYDKAIELNKIFFDAYWNRSLILLLLGKFEKGWTDYEFRFKKKNSTDSRIFHKPKWDGSSLKNKKILIVSEQGFGDNIQFIRYLPLVKKRRGYVILECKKELRKLFEDFSGIDEFVEKQNKIVPSVDFDFYIHLMSLPYVFNTNLNTIPNKTPYLKADVQLVERFKEKFSSDSFKIGIVWAGNPNQDDDKNRSITLEKFKFLKEIPGVDLFSLQKGKTSRQLNDFKIINMENYIDDFADMAAIIENLDLVISVDTSVAHLSGAMGKPTWVLLSFVPNWRWLLNRNDSPWYPSMKLFRQPKFGDWDSVFNEINKELRKVLGEG